MTHPHYWNEKTLDVRVLWVCECEICKIFLFVGYTSKYLDLH